GPAPAPESFPVVSQPGQRRPAAIHRRGGRRPHLRPLAGGGLAPRRGLRGAGRPAVRAGPAGLAPPAAGRGRGAVAGAARRGADGPPSQPEGPQPPLLGGGRLGGRRARAPGGVPGGIGLAALLYGRPTARWPRVRPWLAAAALGALAGAQWPALGDA